MSTVRGAGIIASILGTMLVSSCSWLGLPAPTQTQPAPSEPQAEEQASQDETSRTSAPDEGTPPPAGEDGDPLPPWLKESSPVEAPPDSSAPSAPSAPSASSASSAPLPATGDVPMPSPEQQAAAIKMLQEELATLRAERAAERANQAAQAERVAQAAASAPSYPSAPPVSQPQAQETHDTPEPDAAQRRGLRSPSLPKLLPMDMDGKLLGTETTP